MKPFIRWGIMGTGKIAGRFAEALSLIPDAELLAVGSRSTEKAAAFAEDHRASHSYGSYESLVSDPHVDVIYVATPHAAHAPCVHLALDAGKAVLCEKPFAMNAKEAAAMVDKARRKRVFLMEAMWMHFIPLIGRFYDLVHAEAIGAARLFSADFGFKAAFHREHRLFSPELGGGALLDLGVYPVHLATRLWGEPVNVTGHARIGVTGVDEDGAVILQYEGSQLANMYTSIRVDTPVEAVLMGEEGRIRLHRRMHHPTRMTLSSGVNEELIELPFEGNGLQFQAMEVMNCLRNGNIESAVVPLDMTLSVMRTLDRIRRAWGVHYSVDE